MKDEGEYIFGALLALFLGVGFGGGFFISLFNEEIGGAIMSYSLFLAVATFIACIIYFLLKVFNDL